MHGWKCARQPLHRVDLGSGTARAAGAERQGKAPLKLDRCKSRGFVPELRRKIV